MTPKVVILPGPVIREVIVGPDGETRFGAELTAIPEGAHIGYTPETRLSDAVAAGCTVTFRPIKEER